MLAKAPKAKGVKTGKSHQSVRLGPSEAEGGRCTKTCVLVTLERIGASMENEWLTVTEAAEYLGVSTKTIRNYIKSGRLEAERLGPKLILIHIEALERLRVPILATQRFGRTR